MIQGGDQMIFWTMGSSLLDAVMFMGTFLVGAVRFTGTWFFGAVEFYDDSVVMALGCGHGCFQTGFIIRVQSISGSCASAHDYLICSIISDICISSGYRCGLRVCPRDLSLLFGRVQGQGPC